MAALLRLFFFIIAVIAVIASVLNAFNLGHESMG
jgi:hypothetical protein